MERVVFLEKKEGVANVALEEREFGNTFTDRFLTGLKSTFEAIDEDPEIKAVVVHGFGNYFCCGGTKDELIGLYNGYTGAEKMADFTESGIYNLLLNCKVPVIAAMQGHALGAGLALGCSADIIIMGAECIYSANFMKYGFTPGFGASFIVPFKLGAVLGHEMLYSANHYYGKDLKERGAPVKVVEKESVLAAAAKIAGELAEKPRLSLALLKSSLTREIKAGLDKAVEAEMEMHKSTFAQPEVRERIERLFGR